MRDTTNRKLWYQIVNLAKSRVINQKEKGRPSGDAAEAYGDKSINKQEQGTRPRRTCQVSFSFDPSCTRK